MTSPIFRRLNAVFFAGLIGLAAIPGQAEPIQLPEIGSTASTALPPLQQRELGEAFMRQLRRQVELVEDPELNDYLSTLGQRLVSYSDQQPYPYQFFLINDPSINAFAVPGGFIGIHTGLMLATQSESELAGVLAHEIAHITQQHMARAYEAASKLSLPTAAAMLAAVLLGTQNSEAGLAAIASIQAGAAQYQINFTRANEHEADRIGMQILSSSGLDPRGMPAFFQRLSQTSRYASKPPAFLSTHPVTTDRIAESQARAESLEIPALADSTAFELARTRLQILTATDLKRLTAQYRSRAQHNMDGLDPAQDAAAHYGYALCQIENGETGQARKLLESLSRRDPDRLAYHAALGKVAERENNFAGAQQHYAHALRIYPGNATLIRYSARALLQTGRANEAQELLEKLLRRNTLPSPEHYQLLAQAAQAQGRKADSHSALAEFHYLRGEPHAAVAQIELALKQPALNFYDTARLEARLAEFKTEALKDTPR